MRMYYFYSLVLVPVLGLVGLLLLVSTPPGEESLGFPVAWLLIFVSLFGVGSLVVFLLAWCLGPRKGDSKDRHSLDDGIRPDS